MSSKIMEHFARKKRHGSIYLISGGAVYDKFIPVDLFHQAIHPGLIWALNPDMRAHDKAAFGRLKWNRH